MGSYYTIRKKKNLGIVNGVSNVFMDGLIEKKKNENLSKQPKVTKPYFGSEESNRSRTERPSEER